MNFIEAKKYALGRLQNELSPDLFYHHVNHTLDVCQAIEEIAKDEGVDGDDLTLLRTAGIFHDLGFIKQYFENEPVAASIAADVLPRFGYNEEQIEIIRNLILATKVPQKPRTHLEKIICDSDLDYLGRDDFYDISQSLMKEWIAYGLVDSEEEFNNKQLAFFNSHNYFTKTAKKKREALKEKHYREVEKLTFQ